MNIDFYNNLIRELNSFQLYLDSHNDNYLYRGVEHNIIERCIKLVSYYLKNECEVVK